MELRDVTWMDWRRAFFCGVFGAVFGMLLRVVVAEPWVGVHATAGVMAWFMMDASLRRDETEALREELAELEKTVVVLRSTMHEMAMVNSKLEATNRKLGWRNMVRRESSASSL